MTFRSIKRNPALDGLAEISPDIVYSNAGGKNLTLRVIYPWKNEANAGRRYPLILFVQGSGWTFPNINYEIPQLSWYARHGYVVATVTHRNCYDGFPFPAFLQDVKCALRFMRAHADDWSIDPERVTVFGTSSGGNTALLVGLTGDDPRYKTDEYADQSDAVSAVVECFGPTDMFDLNDYHTGGTGTMDLVYKLLGDPETEKAQALAREMSPLFLVKDGMSCPPVMILHGDADHVVPYESQGVRMAERLDEAGADVTLIRIEGADHEGDFWSDELHDIILEFIDRTMR